MPEITREQIEGCSSEKQLRELMGGVVVGKVAPLNTTGYDDSVAEKRQKMRETLDPSNLPKPERDKFGMIKRVKNKTGGYMSPDDPQTAYRDAVVRRVNAKMTEIKNTREKREAEALLITLNSPTISAEQREKARLDLENAFNKIANSE